MVVALPQFGEEFGGEGAAELLFRAWHGLGYIIDPNPSITFRGVEIFRYDTALSLSTREDILDVVNWLLGD